MCTAKSVIYDEYGNEITEAPATDASTATTRRPHHRWCAMRLLIPIRRKTMP